MHTGIFRILHTADWHLRGQTIGDAENCLNALIEKAADESVDIVIHAGDALDSRNTKMDSEASRLLFSSMSKLAHVAPIVVIAGTPSHEGDATEILRYIKASHPIEVVCQMPEQLLLVDNRFVDSVPDWFEDTVDAVITAVPAPTKKFFKSDSEIRGTDNEIAQAMAGIFGGFAATAAAYPAAPHILVGHWNVTGSLVSETQTLTGVDIEISRDQMAMAQADLVCLGHIHYHQQIGENIYFSGSVISNNYGELEDKGFYIHDFGHIPDDNSEKPLLLESRFVELPGMKRVVHRFDITGDTLVFHPEFFLVGGKIDHPETIVRVEIKLYADDVDRLDRPAIRELYLSAGAKSVEVILIRVPRVNVRSEEIRTAKTLAEKISGRAALIGDSVPGGVLQKAARLEATNPDTLISEVGGLEN